METVTQNTSQDTNYEMNTEYTLKGIHIKLIKMNSVKVSSWMTFAWIKLDLKVLCFLLVQINTLGHQNLKRFFLTTIHFVKACTVYHVWSMCTCVCGAACVYVHACIVDIQIHIVHINAHLLEVVLQYTYLDNTRHFYITDHDF